MGGTIDGKQIMRERIWEIFHRLWGQARGDGERPRDYNKSDWNELQTLLYCFLREEN